MENNEEIYVHMKIYDIRKATSKKRVRVKRKRETSWNQKDKNHRAAKEQKKKTESFSRKIQIKFFIEQEHMTTFTFYLFNR